MLDLSAFFVVYFMNLFDVNSYAFISLPFILHLLHACRTHTYSRNTKICTIKCFPYIFITLINIFFLRPFNKKNHFFVCVLELTESDNEQIQKPMNGEYRIQQRTHGN